MLQGDVEFARRGGVAIAYQMVGDGALDPVYLPAFVSNLVWHGEYALYARFLDGSPRSPA